MNGFAYQRRTRERGFTLIELVGGLAMLGMLFGFFYPALRGVRDAQRVFERESCAVIVMANVLERIEAAGARDTASVRRVFREEFAASPLAACSGVRAMERETDAGCVLVIRRANDAVLARLEIQP